MPSVLAIQKDLTGIQEFVVSNKIDNAVPGAPMDASKRTRLFLTVLV